MADRDEETTQLSLTIKTSTLEALERLYPHLLKPQHQLLAAVSEVEENRIQTRALLDFQRGSTQTRDFEDVQEDREDLDDD